MPYINRKEQRYMRRIYISLAIFIVVIAISTISNIYIKNTSENICIQLMAIKTAATDNDFSKANAAYKDLNKYFSKQEQYLSLLIKHDNISSFAVSLKGISAYLKPENKSDLICEIDKATENAKRIDDVFSAVF